MRTYRTTVNGFQIANKVVDQLIEQLQWFQFEPLPDGEYEITVKEENKKLLNALCGYANPDFDTEDQAESFRSLVDEVFDTTLGKILEIDDGVYEVDIPASIKQDDRYKLILKAFNAGTMS
jgi:hypothetical protein